MSPKYEPINPDEDPRVTHEFAALNGRRYHYVQGIPRARPVKGVALCIHGFPDLWYGWRHIFPALLDMGLRVIAPDMIGYGQTDMPCCPPDPISAYSWKSSAEDMAELLRQLDISKTILLGHDWGGVIVTRIAIWFPHLVSHIISICTPFLPPRKEYIPPQQLVRIVPSFTYQLGFANPQTEKDLESAEAIGSFLRALYRGSGDPGTGKFQVTKDMLQSLGDQNISEVWTQEVYKYYVKEYSRNGMHGPLNWYKTNEQNFDDEKGPATYFSPSSRADWENSLDVRSIEVPYLFIRATKDVATASLLGEGQNKYIKSLTTRELPAGHWVLIEAPDEVIAILKEWIEREAFGGKVKL